MECKYPNLLSLIKCPIFPAHGTNVLEIEGTSGGTGKPNFQICRKMSAGVGSTISASKNKLWEATINGKTRRIILF
jgi:hypothetical protein